jgi:D-alanyl-D-alanine dipeptidase
MKLVDVSEIIPDLIVDLRYASINNVCNKIISEYKKPYLDYRVSKALKLACDDLRLQQYRLVIWDAMRTTQTQLALREVCSDDRFVAKESLHTKGLAIDATLADKSGKLLDLGTDLDDFTAKAYSSNREFSDQVLALRATLVSVLEAVGFIQLPSEWWHFQYDINLTNIYRAKKDRYVQA